MWQDIRYAVRQMLAARGFSIVAALTLALGVGANTGIFSFADGMLFRPLPFREPDRLVLLNGFSAQTGQKYSRVDYVDVEAIRTSHLGIEGIGYVEQGSGL